MGSWFKKKTKTKTQSPPEQPVLFSCQGWHSNPWPNCKSQELSGAFCHIFLYLCHLLLSCYSTGTAGNSNGRKSHKHKNAWLGCVSPEEQQEVKMTGILLPLPWGTMLIMEETPSCFPLPRGRKRDLWSGEIELFLPLKVAYKHILLHEVVKIATCNTRTRFLSQKWRAPASQGGIKQFFS